LFFAPFYLVRLHTYLANHTSRHCLTVYHVTHFLQLPDDLNLVQRDPGELVVAGVYVRLLVQNPGWSLRRPVEFLSEGLNALCALLAREPHQPEQLELLCQALCGVLQRQPPLRERLPAMGHLPQLAQGALAVAPARLCCLRLLHEAAHSQ
ncbi:unnamed protein product, partial [Ixodes pacificus]